MKFYVRLLHSFCNIQLKFYENHLIIKESTSALFPATTEKMPFFTIFQAFEPFFSALKGSDCHESLNRVNIMFYEPQVKVS